MKLWINFKVKRESLKGVDSYNFDLFECEICKMPLPQLVKNGEKIIEMINISKPDQPYIAIENWSRQVG